MRRRLPLVLALAAFLLVIVFLVEIAETPSGGDADLRRPTRESLEGEALLEEAAGIEAEAKPQLMGRAQHEAALEEHLAWKGSVGHPLAPTHWVKGLVVDADGSPVPGARVYQLAGVLGKPMAVRSLEYTDAAGRFRLPIDAWEGTTFAARTPTHGAVFVSAADLRPEAEIRLVFPRPMELNVLVVRPDGSGLEGVSVTVGPVATRRPGVYLEEPDTPAHDQIGVTDVGGAARFFLTRSEPVRITPEVVDATFDPASIVLERPEGHVTFEVREGVRIVLQVIDTETGEHLREAIHVTIHDVATWEQIDSFRTDDSADEIDETLALAPRHYAIEVTAKGREPELVSDIVVEYPGQRFDRDVRMQPMSAAGELVIEFPPGAEPARETLEVGHALYPHLLLQRLDGGHAVRGYRGVGVRPDRAEPVFRIPLRPGRYEGLLVLGATGEVALLRELLVVPGEETRYQVSPRRGTTLALAELVPEGVVIVRARAERPGVGSYPLVGRGLGAPFGSQDALLSILARLAQLPKAKRQEVVFGPYPPGGATIVVTDAENRTYRGHTR